MKKNKIFKLSLFSFMVLWFCYQNITLKNGYHRYFMMFMVFISIFLILMTAFDIKPPLRKKEKSE